MTRMIHFYANRHTTEEHIHEFSINLENVNYISHDHYHVSGKYHIEVIFNFKDGGTARAIFYSKYYYRRFWDAASISNWEPHNWRGDE